jgi:arylsulfatase A-like enzyme
MRCASVMPMEVRLEAVRSGCRVLTIAVLVAVATACSAPSSELQPPANLLLITLDTLRADHLGCYGYPRPTTPALDRFASGATRFADVTCSMPTTLPSHVTIFTGEPPERHGVTRNGQVLDSYPPTIFDLLAEDGARTAAIVSAGVVEARYVKRLGFEEVIFDRPDSGVFQVGAKVVSDNALRWLEQHGPERFALWLHYYDPHEPYHPPAEMAARFTGSYAGPLPDALTIDWLVGLNDPAAAAKLSAADRQHVVDLYDAEIAFLDSQIARVLTALDTTGLSSSTLVVVVADHGQAHGESSFWGHGERLLEPVIKVPLLVRVPGQSGGRVVSAAVETLDLMPSLIDWFELEPMAGLPGRSLAPAARGEPISPAARRVVVRRSYPEAPERAGLVVHRVDIKGTYYREPSGETYHVGHVDGAGGLDGENFFGVDAESSRWLSWEVARFLAGSTSGPTSSSPEDLEMLRALGYVE